MSLTNAQLPDNIEVLKGMIISYDSEIRLLKEQISFLQHRMFGRKSEKHTVGDGQLLLFNEAELTREQGSEQEPEEQIHVEAHTKRRGCRKPLPADLPRIQQLHDIPEEDKQCACGAQKSRIGEEISEQLDYIPATVQVLQHIRPKYACKHCEGVEAGGPTVAIAQMPAQMLPKSIATPGLLSHIIISKYTDHLPLYRQEKIFERLGIELKRQTMASWVIKAAERCEVLFDLLRAEIRSGPLIQIDETPVQVLKEPGRSATTKSYMWVFRGGTQEKPALVYQYRETRGADGAREFLDGYAGYVLTDGYAGYDFIEESQAAGHLGCWAHVRRKFVEAQGGMGKGSKKKGRSHEALEDYIGKLYAVEQSARARMLDAADITALRDKQSRPLLEAFRQWLDETALITPPGSLLGKAVSYALNQWGRLIVYLQDGHLSMDNNLAENAIRPFVLGRKNWLFADTPAGAHASAGLYSLIETAKANGLEPYWYLRYLFEQLPLAQTNDDFKALLPQYVDKTKAARPT